MDNLTIVFGFTKSGYPDATTLTHATEDLKVTLCGRQIPDDWYTDDWLNGPECKRCQGAITRREEAERCDHGNDPSECEQCAHEDSFRLIGGGLFDA